MVALIPARTDTRYWHEHVAGSATVFFLRGRLRFGAAGAAAPFPSALPLWGATAHQVASLEKSLPDAWVVTAAMRGDAVGRVPRCRACGTGERLGV